ncbi:MAG: hypothetical protein LAT65_00015 [Saccharospirillum sp.]|nr:hypothetical protein [Saccharospirillum sp.]
MPSTFTAEQISQALFQSDPMHTCCQENDCFDEYDTVSNDVAERVSRGQPIEAALHDVLSEWFYDGDPIAANTIKPVMTLLLSQE